MAINKIKEERGLHKPMIKVQGIWTAIRDQAQEYYDTFAPHVDIVAFNLLIDYLGNDSHIEFLENFTGPQQYQRLVIGADGLVMKCSNDQENREIIGDANKQTIHALRHSEKMKAVRDLHKRDRGFMKSAVCKHCYLPRKLGTRTQKSGGARSLSRTMCYGLRRWASEKKIDSESIKKLLAAVIRVNRRAHCMIAK